MSATSCVLAAALLTASPDAPVPLIDAGDWPALQAALYSQAVEWELLDPREERLLRLEEFAADLTVLRRRHQELKDAPPLGDARRFPDRGTSADWLNFNRAYRRHLEARRVIDRDRTAVLKDAGREADHLYQVWDAVREARCDIYYVPVRRVALKRLRDLIGNCDYQAANLPPPVPLWRFAEER
jgi:hypothetical protein